MSKLLVIYESDSGMNPPVRYVVNIANEDILTAQVMKFFREHVFGYDNTEAIDALYRLNHDNYCWIQEKWLLSLNEAMSSL